MTPTYEAIISGIESSAELLSPALKVPPLCFDLVFPCDVGNCESRTSGGLLEMGSGDLVPVTRSLPAEQIAVWEAALVK